MNIKNLFRRNKKIDLEKEELEIIDHVHEFGSTIAREIMTPGVDIRGFPGELLVQDCLQEIKTSKYSRFPIYKDNLDEILGVIHVKDIIKNIDKNDIKLSQIDNKVIFVPESMPINDVLKAMKKQRQQMVIVVGEYGATNWSNPERDLAVTIPVILALPVESATSLSPTIIFWLVASIVIPAPTCIRSALGSKVIVWVPIVKMPVILALPDTSRAKPDFADVPIPTF